MYMLLPQSNTGQLGLARTDLDGRERWSEEDY